MNAQLRKIHAYPFIKPHDSLEILRSSRIVSGCVNVLSQNGYESDINSESVISLAVRKLPRELQNKWMTYVLRGDSINENLRVFSAWLTKIARVQDNRRWQFRSSNDKDKPIFNSDKPKTTSFAATSYSGSLTKTQCFLKDGEHKTWQCGKFKNMKLAERQEDARKAICVSHAWALDTELDNEKPTELVAKRDAASVITFYCIAMTKNPTIKETATPKATANNADAVIAAISCTGSLQIVTITLSSGNISIETMAFCDTGSTLSFVDKSLRDQLDVPGN